MDLNSVSVHKHAKKELGPYPAILTSHLVNNPYLFPGPYAPIFIKIKFLLTVSICCKKTGNKNIENHQFWLKLSKNCASVPFIKFVLEYWFACFSLCFFFFPSVATSSRERPPLLSDQFFEIPKASSQITIFGTCCKPLVSNHGHFEP